MSVIKRCKIQGVTGGAAESGASGRALSINTGWGDAQRTLQKEPKDLKLRAFPQHLPGRVKEAKHTSPLLFNQSQFIWKKMLGIRKVTRAKEPQQPFHV